ncbi:hypothetical protein [Paenibacillus turpanensis]|uniref:hypothetical protein n=1 Tax=Paenibacillus turpanensis TaxID=2689078 RepID=UPI00140E8CE6|nr:hypothetical protein [Paenibacillus turpanensis]
MSKNNLILFPKALDYYQIELTKMLESERYREAAELLRFLIECKNDDERLNLEWMALLEWLGTAFPSALKPLAESDAEPESDEREMLRRMLADKSQQDDSYVNKLIYMLDSSSLEKQLIALDQLAHIKQEGLADKLVAWLRPIEAHPFIQFKILQIAAEAGLEGPLTLRRGDELITVEIERTPLLDSHFPKSLMEIVRRVQQVSGIHDPTIAYFAEQTWRQYIAFVYGTNVYALLSHLEDAGIDAWAAALHLILAESVAGEAPRDEILEYYGVTSDCRLEFENACVELGKFLRSQA